MASSKVSSLTASDALAGTELFYADGLASAVAADVKVTSTQIKTWTSASPTLVTPVLGVATGTSIALGGATLGTNALAVTGTANISGAVTGSAFTTGANATFSNFGASAYVSNLGSVSATALGFILNSSGLLLQTTVPLGWVSGSNFNNAADTILSRNAAGVIQFGTTAANAAGAWLAAKGTLTGGTLADQAQVLAITATQPASPSTTQTAITLAITSAGSASQLNRAFDLAYGIGYTGNQSTYAMSVSNAAAGTAGALIRASGFNASNGNIGIRSDAAANVGGSTTVNVGVNGNAEAAPYSVGVVGAAQVAKNSATNIGVVGSAINTGTTPVQIGGFFSLNQTTVPTVSAALIADNGAQTDAIALFRDNNTTKISIVDGGQMTFAAAVPLAFSSGTNQRAGNATLIGGTVTVSNTTVTANTVVMLTRKTSGGTIGTAITYTLSAATSFTINSDNILDTSTFSYMLIEVP